MKFKYNDGGRQAAGYKGHAGDCVVRAIAIAAEKPYQEVYDALNTMSKSERKTKRMSRSSSSRTGIYRKTFEKYILSLGFEWTPTMQVGSGCKVHLTDGELPMGRLIVSVSRHLTAVIDGVINDTYNPSERGCTVYPNSYPEHLLPKGAYRMKNGNGFAYSPQRCVYGYYKLITQPKN